MRERSGLTGFLRPLGSIAVGPNKNEEKNRKHGSKSIEDVISCHWVHDLFFFAKKYGTKIQNIMVNPMPHANTDDDGRSSPGIETKNGITMEAKNTWPAEMETLTYASR